MVFRFIIVLLFASFSFPGNSQNITREILDKVKEATVFVQIDYEVPVLEFESSASGTGFFINDKGYIATNYHVIQPLVSGYGIGYPAKSTKITAIQNSGKKDHRSFDCTVMTVDKDNDLAILKIDDTLSTPFLDLHITDDQMETSPIWVFGYPFGTDFSVIQRGPEVTITKGAITALRHTDKDVLNTIQVDAIVNPGNSGGPCINAQGNVIGVINMSGGESKHNFGIPSHYLSTLMSTIHMPGIPDSELQLTVNSDPSGTSIFMNADDTEHKPGQAIGVAPGYHSVYIMKEGFETALLGVPVSKDTTLKIALNPVKSILLQDPEEAEPSVKEPAFSDIPVSDNLLMQEDFNREDVFESWEQSTGGLGERTWFLEDSKLRQFEDDGLLHSIYLGDESWSNYMVKAKVKIDGKEGDPRAGIIFRETSRGFYLFRIFRESNKAQLAYHSKTPFGWTVLHEKQLPVVDDGWHDLAVAVTGDIVSCFIDSRIVFHTTATYSRSGRIGFYSVESQPSFDSLKVLGIGELGAPYKPEPNGGVISYWFTDHFAFNSESWYQYKDRHDQPFPWLHGDAGCVQMYKDEHTYSNKFVRYRFSDFSMRSFISFGEGTDDAAFEIFFGKTENKEFLLRFSKKEEEVQLIRRSGSEEDILEKEELTSEFFDDVHGLEMRVSNGELICTDTYKDLLEYSGRALVNYSGYFGFNIKGAAMGLHQLHMASVGY